MEGNKFWDRNPKKFRLLVLFLTILLVTMVIYNMINYASTVFSGTVYMQLPSKSYIKKSIIINNFNGSVDTISPGSFLMSINGSTVSNPEEYNNALKKSGEDSLVSLNIFKIEKIRTFNSENIGSAYFKILSDTFYVKKSKMPNDYLIYVTNGSLLGYIVSDGATEKAGLKTGDLLLAIKDREVIMDRTYYHDGFDMEFYRFFRGLSKGEPIPFSILRDGETLTFNVWLATFGISTTVFLVVLCGLSFITLGTFYGLKRPNFIAARLIALGFILIGFEIAISLNIGYADYNLYNYLKIYLSNVALIFFHPIIFNSLLYFPDKNTRFLSNRWYIRIFYIISAITFALFSFWYFTDINKTDNGIILIMLFSNVLFYVFARIKFANKTSSENNKVLTKINILWIVIIISVYSVPLLNFFGVKDFPSWSNYDFLLLFLVPLSYLYFTWRYRLLDIDFRLRRNIQYVLITVLWKAILLVLFGFVLWKSSFLNINFPNLKLTSSSIEILSTPLDSVTNLFYNKLLFILIAFISGAISLKVGKSGQSFFDKKFYRQKFDYKYAQEELVRLFQKKFTLESLARVIVEKVSTLVRVKIAGVVFSGDGKKVWDGKMYCFDNLDSKLFSLDIEQKYFETIKGYKGTFSINYLPVESKNYFEGNRFLYVVPIKVNERLLGALFIGEKLSETLLKGEDFEFLSALITSTSIAVENAFLYEELTKRERIKKELEIAHNIQVASLPQNVPVIPGLDISATSIPALEVGGDFYDFLNGTANGLTIVMGDVSGKGTSAALYMSKVQGIFQTLHEFNLSPVKLLTRANHLLYKHIDSKSYITAVGANFDTENKTLSFARAGHLPLYYYNHNLKEIRKIQPCGMGLGLSEKNIFDYSIEEIRIEYSTGDVFLFVSDGVIEALNRAGEQYGESKLLELMKKNTGSNSQKMVNEILDSVKSFTSDTSQFDDITVVAVKSV
jgi:phosphoserine phosphatase RsbU/P